MDVSYAVIPQLDVRNREAMSAYWKRHITKRKEHYFIKFSISGLLKEEWADLTKTLKYHLFFFFSMKLQKTVMRYCPFCRKHTEHKVSMSKKRAARPMTYGSKARARKRGRARGYGNMGRYSKPALSKFKMTGKKATKKTDLRYECKECKKSHAQREGFRAKKVEFV